VVSGNLAAFLRARLLDDEKAANAAVWPNHGMGPHWSGDETMGTVTAGALGIVWEACNSVADNAARHIARWDPARVLAEVAAKRVILRAHRRTTYTNADLGIHDRAVCLSCHGRMDSPDNWSDDAEWSYPLLQQPFPCDTVRALAQPYADHPDFDPAWRADGTWQPSPGVAIQPITEEGT